jgi:hypothetical protein
MLITAGIVAAIVAALALAPATPAAQQGRDCEFGSTMPAAVRSLQGQSAARWVPQPQNRGIFGCGGAEVREFFDRFTLPGNGGTWLIVTTVVDDPTYLTQEFVISSQFRKETDASKWSPRPCDIPAPRAPRRG